MPAIDELKKLLSQETPPEQLQDWVIGKIPNHYKRLSCDRDEAKRLAKIGQRKIGAYYGDKLFFTQAVIAGAIFSDSYDNVIICTSSQYGKLIADDEQVLTKNGWKKHGDLVVGDEVIAPNGEFVKVTHVHPKGYANREVVFRNGDIIKCHENHEWFVHDRDSRKDRVLETKVIEKRLTSRNNFAIPVKKPLVGEQRDLPVDPYVLGAWLGDGSSTKGQICSSKQDIAVLDECRKFYPNGSEWVHKDTGVITRNFNGLSKSLSVYGLCMQHMTLEKYIPEDYLTASYEQRLRLLAGLIDTDGYTDKNSRTVFTTASETLRDSFETLISTFGWKTSTVTIQPRMSSSGIQGRKPYYVIGFNAGCDIPCVLERKRPFRFAKQKRLGIKEIRSCEDTIGNCITVEGGVYCVGKHLIPTHNSFLMGRAAIIQAYESHTQYLCHATKDGTDIIMNHIIGAISNVDEEVQLSIEGMNRSKLDRLATSLSKSRIAFPERGSVEAITLGATYTGEGSTNVRNKAVGRGGDYIIDEAAFIDEDTYSELGRGELNKLDGEKSKFVAISNPHQAGWFWDELVQEEVPERTLVIWMDALTCLEEQRWTKEQILNSKYAKNPRTIRTYWLCELDTMGEGMFETPKRYDGQYQGEYTQYFLGVDAAYKGKDNICVCLLAVGDTGKLYVEEIQKVYKGEWIDGVTSKDIEDSIMRVNNQFRVAKCSVDVGFGVWLVEGLARRGCNVSGVNFGSGPTNARVRAKHYSATNAANMRAEMHLDLQNLLDSGMIEFSEQAWSKVKDIFPFVVCERRASGKIIIRPKSEIKARLGRSPDELDCVLLAIHSAITFGSENYEYIVD